MTSSRLDPHNLAFIVVAVSALSATLSGCQRTTANQCGVSGAAVVVVVRDHSMWLCDQGHALASYRVALGRGGFGKTTAGDAKTPLGTYALGLPRPSARFGTFIPVAYPTPEQRRQGFTGTDIGIHGPDRSLQWAGRMNLWFDWTAGCIALATDAEVQQIATFVRERGPKLLVQ